MCASEIMSAEFVLADSEPSGFFRVLAVTRGVFPQSCLIRELHGTVPFEGSGFSESYFQNYRMYSFMGVSMIDTARSTGITGDYVLVLVLERVDSPESKTTVLVFDAVTEYWSIFL